MRRRIALSACIILLAAAMAVRAHSPPPDLDCVARLDAWFDIEPRANQYAAVRPQLETILVETHSRALPCDTLFSKLNEGATKRVRPELLVLALDAELDRLVQAHEILAQVGLHDGTAEATREIYQTMSIMLVAGPPGEVIEHILQLGHIVAASNLGPEGYSALASLFTKGQLYRVSRDDMLALVTDSFAHGGGLIQIDQELNRRRPRR